MLARDLAGDADRDPVVLGLARGGVPVAFEIARALGAPLDVFVVRKLGVPAQPELGMGAIAEGGARVLNREMVAEAGVSDAELAEAGLTPGMIRVSIGLEDPDDLVADLAGAAAGAAG